MSPSDADQWFSSATFGAVQHLLGSVPIRDSRLVSSETSTRRRRSSAKGAMKPPPFQRSSMISACLSELGVELPHELLQAELLHVGHVDIADLAAGQLVDHGAVVGDPGRLAQAELRLATGLTTTWRRGRSALSATVRSTVVSASASCSRLSGSVGALAARRR
jgi:hypothetical protein